MIKLSDIHKSFGPVKANRGASLDVATGEIHALVGENGAGKSTLMRILSGMFRPDGGRIEVHGKDVTGWHTAEAIRAGVGMVHQHFMLVAPLTVTENVTLGAEVTKGVQLDRARARREVQALVDRTGLVVAPDQRIAELTVGEAQRVEILKTLYRGAKVLILDEPTAVLSPQEVNELWRVLRKLRDEGGTIVVITHKLDEVMAISDTITVMRQGETVGRLQTKATTPAEIARMMVGRDVELAARKGGNGKSEMGNRSNGTLQPPISDSPFPISALEVKDVTVASSRKANAVDRVSFSIAPGEIFGIAGVEGNGQTELLEAIAGLRRASAGTIHMGDADLTRLSVRDRGDLGLSHIPEDRHERGLVLEYSIATNLILGQQHYFTKAFGLLDRQRIATHAEQLIRTYDIRPSDPMLPARALSGGNQQKIVIAREMGGARDFKVLLAVQPTRGVDVGAIEFIHTQLRDARAAGKAILLVSADLTEVLALSDRIGVMYEGRIVTVVPGVTATAEQLGLHMTGAAA
jgi:general nucleoside transport system ATP-binding protein